MATTTPSQATQEFVPIKEIRDGVLILNDGSLRAILMTSSLNFALKSQDEQNSIIFQFQNFLNSLNFSVQIFVESRKLDIRPYIALLEQREKEQRSDLMKVQTHEYIDFIRNFTDSTNIMSKSFFIVIPFTPAILQAKKGKGITGGLFKKKNKDKGAAIAEASKDFEEYRTQLEQRIDVVEQGLIRCGIRVVKLGTEELVELFYKIFNPGETEKPIPLG
jgi:type IV secretory pathway VirB4 component